MDLLPCDPLEQSNVYSRFTQQDSDSENEGGQGNVTRVVMRPPGHSGKAKRGHLCFDASFETGNLGRVDLISEYEYDLFIRPDTCNPRFRLWFNFIVDNIRVDQRVIFNIVNFSKNRNLYREGMTPIVKSTSRPKWQRMPNKHVYYYRSPEHQNHYVLSFAFGFDREEDVYQFAFSYPYSYSRCQAHLEQLERRQMPYFKRDLIGNSVQQRRLDLITITHPQNMRPGVKRRVVFVLSRIHPGESPASYVCQGLIDFLVSSHPIALALRQYVVFKIIPMMNPDGVFLGNYRSSLMGFDLNRTWNLISQWAHPTINAVHSQIMQLNNDADTELDFVLDIHAHSNLQGTFIYGNTYDDVYRYERHIVFPKILAHNAEDYNPANTMYNRDSVKAGTTRRYFCDSLNDSVNCYTLEVSFYGYQRPNTQGVIQYTEESYFRLGRNVARTYLDYYKFIGVVPTSLPASLSHSADRRSRSRARHRPHSGRSAPSRAHATLSPRQLKSAHRSSSSGCGSSDESLDSAHSSPGAPRGRSTGQLRPRFPPARASPVDRINALDRQKKCVVPCRQIAAPEPEARAILRGISGVKSLTGRKVGGGGMLCCGGVDGSSAPVPRPSKPPVPPSLTIIDFNQLARGGLEVASGRDGPGKGRGRDSVASRRINSSYPQGKVTLRPAPVTAFGHLSPIANEKEKR